MSRSSRWRPLLEIRPVAIAEAQRLCSDLLRAQLVRLDDGTWLDVLTWSRPDSEQRLVLASKRPLRRQNVERVYGA